MPEEIDVACPGCNAIFGVPLEFCGELAECAECSTVFEIPIPDEGEETFSGTDTGAIQGLESDGETTNTVRLSRTGIGMIPQVKDNFTFGETAPPAGGGFFGASPTPKAKAAPAMAPVPKPKAAPAPIPVAAPAPKPTLSAPVAPAASPAPAPAASTDTGAITINEDDGGVVNTVKLSRSGIGMIPQMKENSAPGDPDSGGFFGATHVLKPNVPKPAPAPAPAPAPVPQSVEKVKVKPIPAPVAKPVEQAPVIMTIPAGKPVELPKAMPKEKPKPVSAPAPKPVPTSAGKSLDQAPAAVVSPASKPVDKKEEFKEKSKVVKPGMDAKSPEFTKDKSKLKPAPSFKGEKSGTTAPPPKSADKLAGDRKVKPEDDKKVKSGDQLEKSKKGTDGEIGKYPVKSSERRTDRPGEKRMSKPGEKRMGKPGEKRMGKPGEKRMGKPGEKRTGKPMPPVPSSKSVKGKSPSKSEKTVKDGKASSVPMAKDEGEAKPTIKMMLPEWTKVTLNKGEEVEDVAVAKSSGVAAGIIATIFIALAGAGSIFAGNIVKLFADQEVILPEVGGLTPEQLVMISITAIVAILAFITLMIIGKCKIALMTTSERAVGVVGKKRLEIKK